MLTLIRPIWDFVVPLNASTQASLTPGYIFNGPIDIDLLISATIISDQEGNLVWDGSAIAIGGLMAVAQYKNEPVITMWTGTGNAATGHGSGYDLLVNSSYDVIANFTAVGLNGTLSDLHELQITSNNTALITAYQPMQYDLTAYNGSADGWLYNVYAQEIDIETGEALFTWSAIEHVSPSMSYMPLGDTGTSDSPWDFFHMNSIAKDDDGNYLINSRHCWTIHYVDGPSGDIIWRMGGKNSSFAMGNGTNFEWEHDARFHSNGTKISVFDNAGTATVAEEPSARGLLLDVDYANRTVALAMEFLPYNRTITPSQGSVQIQPNGNVLVGFGQEPYFAEYTSAGDMLYSVLVGAADVASYRTLRFDWTGAPRTLPSLVVYYSNSTAYVSWNGATEVDSWNFFGSSDKRNDTLLGNVKKSGFETAFNASSRNSYSWYQVEGLNAAGMSIGRSEFVSAT
ncbi:hypothetical protein FIBSPDRAFT_837791 [Athelia psychrophila]|uniref:ASST-domain-containing protein n=1 Tax=Athelia psychrophila TaxID=1759441 RepID=A0A166A1B7_9AGAM|nr:hypothetical protein FIBSPDRAFT_837791 [Fibularhizoctonia sp. CBS 109695]